MINLSSAEFCKLAVETWQPQFSSMWLLSCCYAPHLCQEHMSTLFASRKLISCFHVDDQPPAVTINCPHLALPNWQHCSLYFAAALI